MLDIQSRGLCLVHEAKDEISALPLCLALIKKSMNSRVGSVEACAVLLLHISEELPKEIGWSKVIEFIEPPENPESVKQSLLSLASNNLRDKKEMALFIDSLAALARHLGVANTSWILQTLTESGAFLVVLADDYSLRLKLSSLADMRIKLDMLAITPNSRNTLFINVNTRKKGVFEEKVEEIEISPDFLLTTRPMQQKSMVHNNLSSPPAVETLVPFDIGVNLKKNEREAKNRVKLPYMENQNEKGLVELKIVSNKKVRAGGQIIYVSEKEDDIDEDDPDDDLTI